MTSAMTLAVAVVRTWTRAYTWGAPSAWAEQRRAEIESDLWEQQQDPNGARGLAPAVRFDDLPTIFSVLRKLGLELKQQEATVPVYTVEHIERPAAE